MPPRLYHPEDVAAVLGCSAWWVKDRARRRLIPFTRVGRAYRFTADHLAEIIRLEEQRPARVHDPASVDAASRTPKATPPAERRQPATATVHLQARPPRRARQSQFDTAA
jgi:hypothetical protein